MKLAQGKLDAAYTRGLTKAREDFKRMEPQYRESPSLYMLHFNLYHDDAERLEVPREAKWGKVKDCLDKAEIATYVKEYFQLIQTFSP